MQIQAAEWFMLLLVVAMPVYSLWESDKVKVAIIEGRKTKLRAYKEAIIFLWIPTSVLLALLFSGRLSPSELGLVWQGNLSNWIGAGLVLAVSAYFFYSIYALLSHPEKLDEFRDAAQNSDWMVPATSKELRWFTLGLSVSAGVCEELLFRGFIIGVLGNVFGVILSLVVGSLLFGLCHLYQGWGNVLRTAIIGLVLGIIYILTESLWVAIALHILIDVYGGFIGYALHKTKPVASEPKEAVS
ncbi:CPBP family intramembrane glutamic endopeptidase [Pseudidiomarina terrestris]|uniref:CPBP family intramembrane metalloprotease n=1 Tax=Pseudidiomarina terrestris TaxID=2820060 RepID=A0AAW7QYR1_9GAMM|nr:MULTISPECIES: type II CAAX endopeptidase family protein [unclassified Pseudidiomarina]MDN7123439.1 CPBP family intramembrane metalloprotease [Pseudidiomarina sp. 1APP75-32.1]MDN7128835.1 CPBP family intramembrane metalloprotease [Pseudidiomarina sp. 1APR75-15]MDN7134903.1 CPBP family intramembrane metalloprotease [Pseudidiomarina sp. 1ASP75-5]